jgi:UDP-glucose 4-epimerase
MSDGRSMLARRWYSKSPYRSTSRAKTLLANDTKGLIRMEKHILITGGAGFIGSHLCELLVSQGHRVLAVDDLSTGSLDNLAPVQGAANFQFVRETITNTQVLDRLTYEASLVIHLAAVVGVKLIVEDPVHTIQTNVMGTEAVLKAANRYGVKVMIASTSEVYGKGVSVPFREEDDCLIGPTSHSRWAYAASKSIDEFLGLAYQRQFGLPVVIMRFFNTIGPRQTERYGMVVPRFVRQALRGEALEVYGDGQQSRCFGHVTDVVKAVTELALHPAAVGQVFNVGATEEITIQELAQRVIVLTGSKSDIHFIPYDQAYAPGFEDMRRRVPSIEKISRLTGYQPSYTLNEMLDSVIAYERNQLKSGQQIELTGRRQVVASSSDNGNWSGRHQP